MPTLQMRPFQFAKMQKNAISKFITPFPIMGRGYAASP